MTEEQLHIVQEINTSDLCSIISSRNNSLEDEIRRLKNENKLLGERCNQLLTDKGKLTDKYNELEAQFTLKITSCIKTHLCKQDEDYDKPIISPKFLSDALDQMTADGFEEIKEK